MVISKWAFISSILLAGIVGQLIGVGVSAFGNWISKRNDDAERSLAAIVKTEG